MKAAKKRAPPTPYSWLDQLLACATPQAGNHYDVFELRAWVAEICPLLQAAGIPVEGLFWNADSGFDTTELRQCCAARHIEANIARNLRSANWQSDNVALFNPGLCRRRTVIKHANTWPGSF